MSVISIQRAANLPSFEVGDSHCHQFVYVLVFEGDVVKIGRTNNPRQRLAQHLSICSLPLVDAFLFGVREAELAERSLLLFFSEYKLNDGEWFVVPKEKRVYLTHAIPFAEINGVKYWGYCANLPQCELCLALEKL